MATKDMNQALIDYTISTTKQIVEFNQKLIADYITFTHNIVTMIPTSDKIFQFGLKK